MRQVARNAISRNFRPPGRWAARRLLASAGVAALIGGGLIASPAAAIEACGSPGAGAPIWVDSECVDSQFNAPVIDSETDVTEPYVARVVSGHFDGTSAKFNIYLPPRNTWQGRFFHNVYPVGDGTAGAEVVAFGNSHGAYTVQTGGTSGYRADAATAKFARTVAASYYDIDSTTINGYLWGGSGGSYQVVGAIENTVDVWQGAVPFVIAAPTSIPNNYFARLLARFVLNDKAPLIADAVRPGGSGDPYAPLSDSEGLVLREVTTLGLPLRAWDDPGYLFGNADGLLGFAATVKSIDPTYMADFWNKDGYLGTEPSDLGDHMRALKVDTIATISEVVDAADGTPTALRFASLPTIIDHTGLTYTVQKPDGTVVGVVSGTFDAQTQTLTLTPGATPAVLAEVTAGANIHLDNRWAVALASYHRHQVPNDRDLTAWAQFLNPDGSPKFPQRPVQIGPLISSSVTGGATYTGNITMKTILVANLLDADAYPWQADWYATRVERSLGSATADRFRVWLNDNADHLGDGGGADVIGSGSPSIPRPTRLIDYTGIVFQAILDVADWVENEHAPAASTTYSANDQQLTLTAKPRQRGGMQPTVDMLVGSDDTVWVRAGQPLRLGAKVQSPTRDEVVVGAEWDFLGNGEFVSGDVDPRPKSTAIARGSFPFTEPGTYIVTVRVTARRSDDPSAPALQNLDRVRVIVE